MIDVVSVVAGREISGTTGSVYRSKNPSALGQTVAEVRMADASVFTQACAAASDMKREWGAVPAPVRGRVIASIGRLVEANMETLAALVAAEIGKPFKEALGEVREIVDTCDFFLGEGRRLYGQTVPSEMPQKSLFTFRNPVGTVAVITAGNFPVAVPAWYIIPALLCGNSVVWKPAEYAAASAQALHRLCVASGLPDGVLNIVFCDGEETYAGLEEGLAKGLVDKVGFTGSSAVGARIGELCGRYLQTPCLELGGKNPMVVMPDADLDLAVEGAVFSGFGTAGQRCTSLGTAIVHESVHEEFIARLKKAVAQAPLGDPMADVLYGPLLSVRFAERFEEYCGWIEPHHTVVTERIGRISADNARPGFLGSPEEGLYYHPVIVDGVRAEDRLFREETFGPLICVTSFDTLSEAIDLANAPGYGLSASIYTSDAKAAFSFRAAVSAGMVSVNNSTSGAEAHLPFGGNGKSGNGSRQSGMWVLDQFTRWQSMNWDYSGNLQKAQMDVREFSADISFRLPESHGPTT
ncbi:aldehyde dehydrogenase [Streptomyces yokosukanensis]|uniref:aldehyde dehydrogenase (NAD(+)) n=1 Tax=Streptomyces yokosukanensis TaxID=67386 RepID=A0A101NRI5_9ACTN|nr:aldehyde dehydrogenase family protein [Streptomyces yokosukanensis]KUM98051.1 aldehyde dehydrogenase [Streptomyces yokosukanensis]